jgi:hypothetical protein
MLYPDIPVLWHLDIYLLRAADSSQAPCLVPNPGSPYSTPVAYQVTYSLKGEGGIMMVRKWRSLEQKILRRLGGGGREGWSTN